MYRRNPDHVLVISDESLYRERYLGPLNRYGFQSTSIHGMWVEKNGSRPLNQVHDALSVGFISDLSRAGSFEQFGGVVVDLAAEGLIRHFSQSYQGRIVVVGNPMGRMVSVPCIYLPCHDLGFELDIAIREDITEKIPEYRPTRVGLIGI